MKKVGRILIGLVLLGAGCSKTEDIATPQQAVEIVTKDAALLGVRFGDLQPHNRIWWVTSDRKNILVREAIASKADLPEPAIDQSGKHQYGPITIKLREHIAAKMTSLGFIRYGKSSSIDMSDDSYYDFIEAFQKNDIVCEFIVDGDSYSSTGVSFACSDQLKSSTEEQLPYLEAIPKNDEAVIADIGKSSGDFVIIDVGMRREGYGAILKKENGHYELITKGQEAPSCDIVEKNDVPNDLVPVCYDVDGQQKTR